MRKTSMNETIEKFENEPEQMEIVLNDDEPEVVYEDVPDEDDLPPGWEDLLYDTWKESQLEKEIEEQAKHSESTK